MKRVELLKVSFLVAFVLGVFCLLFVGMQQFIMQAAQQKQEMVHQFVQVPSIEMMVPEPFEAPFFEILDLTYGRVDETWLSAEEAAEITAFLLTHLLDTRIDELTFRMNVMGMEDLRPWWSTVVSNESHTETFYTVELDAINGELLFFNNSTYFQQLNLQSFDIKSTYATSEINLKWDKNFDALAEHERELSERVRELASILGIDVVAIQLTAIDTVIDSAGKVVDELYEFRVSNEFRFNQMFQVSRNHQSLITFRVE